MPTFIYTLLNNRVTVSFTLLILLIFLVIPGAILLDWKINPNSQGGIFSIPSIIIIFSFSLITICWHIGSSFIKEELIKKSKITDNDFIDHYKGAFETAADLNTFGLAKYIGYARLKTLFACNAVGIIFIISLLTLVAFINFELLILMSEKKLIIPIFLASYLLAAILSYPIMRKKLK